MSRSRKFKLEHPPIIFGDHALELHKIRIDVTGPVSNGSHTVEAHENEASATPLYLLISSSDYEVAKEYYGGSETITPWSRSMRDDKGIHYFANWYHFTYDAVVERAIRIKSKLVVDKQSLLVMLSLPAFDKKNKIARNLSKKYLQDAVNVANSYIA